MTAMSLIRITDPAKNAITVMQKETQKKVIDFIYRDLSRRTRPMDEYQDTYRIKADFFCCNLNALKIYFEREHNGVLIIDRVIDKK